MEEDIITLQKEINTHSRERGYWNNGVELHKKLLLIVSEVTEAMEADRKNKNIQLSVTGLIMMLQDEDDEVFIKRYETLCKHRYEEELADILIRTLDLAFVTTMIPTPLLIALKMRYNKLHKDTQKQY